MNGAQRSEDDCSSKERMVDVACKIRVDVAMARKEGSGCRGGVTVQKSGPRMQLKM